MKIDMIEEMMTTGMREEDINHDVGILQKSICKMLTRLFFTI